MSDSNKRNLPSWMSAREDKEQRRSQPKSSTSTTSTSAAAHDHDFSKLMRGVVFVLSGFVNPERAELRSRALEMGAEFQTDWNPNCTLLICAFPNTPKFQQVEADSGTIVSKEWISECHNHRKLVDIEPYLLHAGKPWRRPHSVSQVPNQDHEAPSPMKSWKQVEKSLNSLPSSCASSEGKRSNQVSDYFSPSRVKKWATDDLGKTLLWLESQDEKPERGEIKKIAVEGILTCLQDTIYTLEQGQDIQQISEQWACIPRVVEELIKFDGGGKGDWSSASKEDLCGHAVACKKIYEGEYSNIAERVVVCEDEEAYESDVTIEMTEEEIEQAYNTVVSSFC